MFRLFFFCLSFLSPSLSFADPLYVTSSQVDRSLTCFGCYVLDEANAVGNNLSSFASMHVPLGILSAIELTLSFPSPLQAGSLVSVVVESEQAALDLLSQVGYRLLHNSTPVATTPWVVTAYGNSSTIKVLSTNGR